MVNKACELCRTRSTSGKWTKINLQLSQTIFELFNTQVNCGRNICNKCRVKVSKLKSKRKSGELLDTESLSPPKKVPKYTNKKILVKSVRIQNFPHFNKKAMTATKLEINCLTDFLALPEGVENIILQLNISDILNLTSTCHSFHKIMTTSVWQKLMERDFDQASTINIPAESMCSSVYAALQKQKQKTQNNKTNLREKSLI